MDIENDVVWDISPMDIENDVVRGIRSFSLDNLIDVSHMQDLIPSKAGGDLLPHFPHTLNIILMR